MTSYRRLPSHSFADAGGVDCDIRTEARGGRRGTTGSDLGSGR